MSRIRFRESNPNPKGETMIQTPTSIENLTLNITQEIHVNASLEVTFDALLEQMGPA